MSIPKSSAQSQTDITHDAAVLAANTLLIADVDAQITEAIARGVYWIVATVSDPVVDPKTVAQNYLDFGYQVSFPATNRTTPDPASLVGDCWEAYWAGYVPPKRTRSPYRIKIAWKP